MKEVSLEDLAMGVIPKKDYKGKKTMPVSTTVKSRVKKMADIAIMQESLSIKALKKFNKTELHMMLKAADELQESLYRTKGMIREAMPKESRDGESRVAHC